METVNDLLPGMGDDSNRFIDSLGENLIIEKTIRKEKITFMLVVKSSIMELLNNVLNPQMFASRWVTTGMYKQRIWAW